MEVKPFWKSKTLWGVLLTALPTLIRVSGVPLPPGADAAILQVVEIIMVTAGLGVATTGRIQANPNLTLRR